jgi:hypothetical protein
MRACPACAGAAAFVAGASAEGVPGLLVGLAGDDHDRLRQYVRELCAAGLSRPGSAREVPDVAPGWLVLACGALDQLSVLAHAPEPLLLFSGSCAMSARWRTAAARAGHLLLFAGKLDLAGLTAGQPGTVSEIITEGIGSGLVAAAKVPVFWSGYSHGRRRGSRDGGRWPGGIRYEPVSGQRRTRVPAGEPGPSAATSADNDINAAVAAAGQAVRAACQEVRAADWDSVRQRLAAELVMRGAFLPANAVSSIARDVAYRGSVGGSALLALRSAERGIFTAGLLAWTIMARLLGRSLPHWHILGLHLLRPGPWPLEVEVTLDDGAAEIMSIGGEDDIAVCVGIATEYIPESAGSVPVVYRGEYKIGTLDGPVSGEYRKIVMDPRHIGIDIVTAAQRSYTPDGQWKLRIRTPLALDGL